MYMIIYTHHMTYTLHKYIHRRSLIRNVMIKHHVSQTPEFPNTIESNSAPENKTYAVPYSTQYSQYAVPHSRYLLTP